MWQKARIKPAPSGLHLHDSSHGIFTHAGRWIWVEARPPQLCLGVGERPENSGDLPMGLISNIYYPEGPNGRRQCFCHCILELVGDFAPDVLLVSWWDWIDGIAEAAPAPEGFRKLPEERFG